MTNKSKYAVGITASVVLGLIFIFAGIGKLFANLPTETDFIENLSPLFAVHPLFIEWIPYILPWAEILLGVCLILQLWPSIVAIIFCVPLISCFLLNNYWMVMGGMEFKECNNCFGIFERFIQLTPQQAFGIDVFLFLLCCIIAFVNQKYPILYGILRRTK